MFVPCPKSAKSMSSAEIFFWLGLGRDCSSQDKRGYWPTHKPDYEQQLRTICPQKFDIYKEEKLGVQVLSMAIPERRAEPEVPRLSFPKECHKPLDSRNSESNLKDLPKNRVNNELFAKLEEPLVRRELFELYPKEEVSPVVDPAFQPLEPENDSDENKIKALVEAEILRKLNIKRPSAKLSEGSKRSLPKAAVTAKISESPKTATKILNNIAVKIASPSDEDSGWDSCCSTSSVSPSIEEKRENKLDDSPCCFQLDFEAMVDSLVNEQNEFHSDVVVENPKTFAMSERHQPLSVWSQVGRNVKIYLDLHASQETFNTSYL